MTPAMLTWTREPRALGTASPDRFSGQLRRTSTLQLTLGLWFVAGTGLRSPGRGHAPGECAHPSPHLPEALAWLGTALPCLASSTRGSPRRAAEFGKRWSFLLSSSRFSRTQLLDSFVAMWGPELTLLEAAGENHSWSAIFPGLLFFTQHHQLRRKSNKELEDFHGSQALDRGKRHQAASDSEPWKLRGSRDVPVAAKPR